MILLIGSGTAGWGGVLPIALMPGALGSHVAAFGIHCGGDPTLFVMALVVLLAGIVVTVIRKGQPPFGRGGKA